MGEDGVRIGRGLGEDAEIHMMPNEDWVRIIRIGEDYEDWVRVG